MRRFAGAEIAETAELAEKAEFAEKGVRCGLRVLCVLCCLCGLCEAQGGSTRLSILDAEDRRAPAARDLSVLRSGARSRNEQIARLAVRALGRLERPALAADIVPALRHELPEVRSEAANALGQAVQGWKREKTPPSAAAFDAVVSPLTARLGVEDDADVRGVICETIGRLPYTTASQVEAAERTLVETAARAASVTDRLGVAKGFEALVRLHRKTRPPSSDALNLLRHLATPGRGESFTGARVRRLALEALIAAGAVDDGVVAATSQDPDAQVRRLAMRAIAPAGGVAPSIGAAAAEAALAAGARDDSPIVRYEALRTRRLRNDADACVVSLAAASDRDLHVALLALDQLGACGDFPDAVAALERSVTDQSDGGSARGWHRPAHGLVALASASPERGAAALKQFTGSRVWQLRMYAARAAAQLKDRATLDALGKDDDDNVREAATRSSAPRRWRSRGRRTASRPCRRCAPPGSGC